MLKYIEELKSMKSLSLSFDHIGADVAAALAEGIKDSNTLQSFDLRFHQIADAEAVVLAEAIKVSNTLQSFRFFCTRIGGVAMAKATVVLAEAKTLQSLDLTNNNIGAAGAAALAEALKVRKILQSLVLSDSNILDAGTVVLAEALKVNTTLLFLDLGCNGIGDTGAVALAEALKVNTTLQSLDLRENYIGAAGLAALAEALKANKILLSLELIHNQIDTHTAAVLAEIETYLERNRGYKKTFDQVTSLLKELQSSPQKAFENLASLEDLNQKIMNLEAIKYPGISEARAQLENLKNLKLNLERLPFIDSFYWLSKSSLKSDAQAEILSHKLFVTPSADRPFEDIKDQYRLLLFYLKDASALPENLSFMISAVAKLKGEKVDAVGNTLGAETLITLDYLRQLIKSIPELPQKDQIIASLPYLNPREICALGNTPKIREELVKQKGSYKIVTYEHILSNFKDLPLKKEWFEENLATLPDITERDNIQTKWNELRASLFQKLSEDSALKCYALFEKNISKQKTYTPFFINDVTTIYHAISESSEKYIDLLNCLYVHASQYDQDSSLAKNYLKTLKDALTLHFDMDTSGLTLNNIAEKINALNKESTPEGSVKTHWQTLRESFEKIYATPHFKKSANEDALRSQPIGTTVISPSDIAPRCFLVSEVTETTTENPSRFRLFGLLRPAPVVEKIVSQEKVIHIDNDGKFSLHAIHDAKKRDYSWNHPLDENIENILKTATSTPTLAR